MMTNVCVLRVFNNLLII